MLKVRIILIFLVNTIGMISLPAQAIRVAIASSLIKPMQEIATQYQKSNGTEIELIPGASGTLAHQIINGAPFDLFISADKKYSEVICNKINYPSLSIGQGSLMMWLKDKPNFNLDQADNKNITKLLNSKIIEDIGISQPETAPYGRATKNLLNSLSIWQTLESKYVYANSVSQTNLFVINQSTDAVFTSFSTFHSLKHIQSGYWVKLDYPNKELIHQISLINQSTLTTHFFNEFKKEWIKEVLVKYGIKHTSFTKKVGTQHSEQ